MANSKKTIVITGGSRGIGRATALLAGARGWNVAINFVANEAAAHATANAVEEAGGQAFALQGDVGEESAIVTLFDRAQAAFGNVHGVVNNAGIVAQAMPLADMSAERLRRIFHTNVYGAYLCAREAARRMMRSRGGEGGCIVNVSSAAARLGSPGEYVDYAGSKGAMDTMTVGLAKELGPDGVRVNAVRPGLIETDIHASSGDATRATRIGQNTPLRRAGEASEVAEAVMWLLSPESSYVNGALLDVSGGR